MLHIYRPLEEPSDYVNVYQDSLEHELLCKCGGYLMVYTGISTLHTFLDIYTSNLQHTNTYCTYSYRCPGIYQHTV